MSRETCVPVVDLAGSDEEVAVALDDAYRNIGFCSVVNHGVPPAAVAAVFEASRIFHRLPGAEKDSIAIGDTHRGFIGLATSTIVTSTVEVGVIPNQSESFMIGRPMAENDPDIVAGRPLAGPNQWPASAPQIREPVLEYHRLMLELCRGLHRHVARALGADSGVFDASFDPATSYLRLLRYPVGRAGRSAEEYGSSPHTDYGFMTVLAVDDVSALEVLGPEGDWHLVEPPEGGLIVNSGDLLHRWSNGIWRSTPHRVYNHPDQVRYSVPFFYEPHVTADVTPLPHLGEPRFETVNYGEYVMHRFRSNYSQHRPAG